MIRKSAIESSCYRIFAGARINPVSRLVRTSRNTRTLRLLRATSAGKYRNLSNCAVGFDCIGTGVGTGTNTGQ